MRITTESRWASYWMIWKRVVKNSSRCAGKDVKKVALFVVTADAAKDEPTVFQVGAAVVTGVGLMKVIEVGLPGLIVV